MKRSVDYFLINWFEGKPRKPLVIRGARQVGKSTSVRNLAQAVKRPLVEINLERHVDLDEHFKSLDMVRILSALESVSGGKKIDANAILFLDEIQATPHALAALRYFYEDRPEIPVIAAGSLLEFVLSDHDFSMPVGRIRFLSMQPMSFCEFLEATSETNLLQAIQTLNVEKAPDPFVHQRILEKLRLYAFVGGMPEAVATFAASQSHQAARDVHDSILGSYKDDFAKYGLRQDLVRLHQLLTQCIRDVERKIKYTRLLPGEQIRTTQRLLNLLIQARLFTRVNHSEARGVPLGADIDPKVFKLLFLDVGLFNSILGLPWRDLQDDERIMQVNEGQVIEQLIGQELLANKTGQHDTQLYYWLRAGRKGNAEVDFIVAIENRVVPIEVKAGKTGLLKSLKLFTEDGKSPLAVRLGPHPISLVDFGVPLAKKKSTQLLSLPLYAVSELGRIVSQL